MVFKPHFISTDTYKLKVEKTIKGVLGRPGGGDLVRNLRGEFGVMWWGKNLWILGLLIW